MLYALIKDFAGPFATTVASVTAALIAYKFQHRQQMLSVAKLRLDLFERKYVVFSACKELLSYVVNVYTFDRCDQLKIRDLYIVLDEGRFFLDPRTIQFLVECHSACERYLETIAFEPTGDQPRSDFAEKAASQCSLLRNFYADLPNRFERELRIAI